MKKIWTTAVVIGLVLTGMVGIVSATEDIEKQSLGVMSYNDASYVSYEKYDDSNAPLLAEKNERQNQLKKDDGQTQLKVKFKGIWGYVGENETAGYVGGFLGRRGRVGFLKGVWNTTNGSAKGRVVGILKRGFFNGKIVTEDGAHRITGLYRIDKEKQVFHLKWMTANKVGWAHCRIKLE